MPRPQPRPNWRALPPDYDLPLYTTEQFGFLFELLRAKRTRDALYEFSESQIINDLTEAARYYLVRCHQHAGPTDGQVKAALTEVNDAAANLMQKVRALDDRTLSAVTRCSEQITITGRAHEEGISLEGVVAQFEVVRVLAQTCRDALEKLNGDGLHTDGDEPDYVPSFLHDPFSEEHANEPFHQWVRELATIYEAYTGVRAEVKRRSVPLPDSEDEDDSGTRSAFVYLVEQCMFLQEDLDRPPISLDRVLQKALQTHISHLE